MASDSSFDIVSRVDMQEVLNAVEQAGKELRQRYDFKGSKSTIELNRDAKVITLVSDDDFKLKSVVDVLATKLAKRKVPLKSLLYGKVMEGSGQTVRQEIKIQEGISQDRAKTIVKLIKNMKLKVQAEIQKDQLRVRAKKKDDLQAVINAVKEKDFDFHIDFINYR